VDAAFHHAGKALQRAWLLCGVRCCAARETSSEIVETSASPDRFRAVRLSNGKFTGADLAFVRRLTKLQFPDALIECAGYAAKPDA
jgi:hypothetical protein